MTIENYADILRFAIKLQMKEVDELIATSPRCNEDWFNGIRQGLVIALEKIDASMFLAK